MGVSPARYWPSLRAERKEEGGREDKTQTFPRKTSQRRGRAQARANRGLKSEVPTPTLPSAPGSCWQMTPSFGCRR